MQTIKRLVPKTMAMCISLLVTSYALDSTEGARHQQVKFTHPGHLFTHLGFPSVRVVLSITFILGFVMIMNY